MLHFKITFNMAHQNPKNDIDAAKMVVARDVGHVMDIYKRKLKGVKKKGLLSVSAMPGENVSAVWDCLLTGQKTDIDKCLRTKSPMSGACKECQLGIEKSGGS